MLFITFFLVISSLTNTSGSTSVGCIQSERQALLDFKHNLKDPNNRLLSWNISSDENCCKWTGVICDNFTGHVIQLDLGNDPLDMNLMLSGKINPSLLALKQLNYLDLSGNKFGGIQVPEFLGSMSELRYLNLSNSGFGGLIPFQLGNLSKLQFLDLKSDTHTMFVENSKWLFGLSSMKYIDLSGVNLTKALDLSQVISAIPFLQVLCLSSCQLHNFSPPSIANFSSLSTLDLSSNQLQNFPGFIFSLKNLVFLDLQGNNFQGPIPEGLQNLISLRHLELSKNNFTSSIPNWIYEFHYLEYLSISDNNLQGIISPDVGNLTSIKWFSFVNNHIEGKLPSTIGKLCKLKTLGLSGNKLLQDISEIFRFLSGCASDELQVLWLGSNQISGNLSDEIGKFRNLRILRLDQNSIRGRVPISLGNLSSLTYLNLSSNQLNGNIYEAHFANLKKLSIFSVNENSLTLKVSPNWVPPFQLQYLGLRSCYIGSQFPTWIQSQKFLQNLDLSRTGISMNIDIVFSESFREVTVLALSGNRIHGKLPNLLEVAPQLWYLDLSSNNLSGEIPATSSGLGVLILGNNSFSGSISQVLSCGANERKSIQTLDLKDNLLSGELPDCWRNLPSLSFLNLENNRFSGNLPTSLGALTNLKSLHLPRNNFTGPLPMSVKSCQSLVLLDISGNQLSGNIPSWIGKGFSDLMILNLRSNKFHGIIPDTLCELAALKILDLSSNNFSGSIPKCVKNLRAMADMTSPDRNYIPNDILMKDVYAYCVENMILALKDRSDNYGNILNLVRYMDLSNNHLRGEIPAEITRLRGLRSINLSHNSLSGRIPKSIGDMELMETIDLSKNQISGEIPQSVVDLTFLSKLNVSYNNLMGKIPSSTQLDGFSETCFVGNKLCGFPLHKNCTEMDPGSGNQDEDEGEDGIVDRWFYVSLSIGFVVGFWGLIGTLIVNRRWRLMYFHF